VQVVPTRPPEESLDLSHLLARASGEQDKVFPVVIGYVYTLEAPSDRPGDPSGQLSVCCPTSARP